MRRELGGSKDDTGRLRAKHCNNVHRRVPEDTERKGSLVGDMTTVPLKRPYV